jgi:hypothetical protein
MEKGAGFVNHEESYDLTNALTGELLDWVYTIRHGYAESNMDDVNQMISQYQTATSSPT